MAARKPLIAGNWKMFGRRSDLEEIAALIARTAHRRGLDIALCLPHTLLAEAVRRHPSSAIAFGAQDAAPGPDGPHTGDVNAAMLADAGARYVIVGHSERRAGHGESDALVATKAASVLESAMTPIICVGETLSERDGGRALAVVERQLALSVPKNLSGDLVIAYEPVWAIGTGRTPSLEQIAEAHGAIRSGLGARAARTRVLYGGSVKPGNAHAIFQVRDVDGALVGGASLKAADFAAIIEAHPGAEP